MEPESQTVQTKRSQPLSKPPPPSSKPPPTALHPYKPQTILKNISPYTVCILQANDHKDELYIYMSEVFLPLCPQVLCEVWKAISDSGGRQRVSSCFKTTTWHLPSSISRFVKHPWCCISTSHHLEPPVKSCVFLPEKKLLVRRKLTLSLKMDSLSKLEITSSEKGSRLASRSSSEFRRSRWRLDGLDLAPSGGVGLTLNVKEIWWYIWFIITSQWVTSTI